MCIRDRNKLGLGIELEGLELLRQRGSTVRGEKNGMKLHSSSRSYGVNSVHAVEFANNGGYSGPAKTTGQKLYEWADRYDGWFDDNMITITSDTPYGDDEHLKSVTEIEGGQHGEVDGEDLKEVLLVTSVITGRKSDGTKAGQWKNDGSKITMNGVAKSAAKGSWKAGLTQKAPQDSLVNFLRTIQKSDGSFYQKLLKLESHYARIYSDTVYHTDEDNRLTHTPSSNDKNDKNEN